MSSGQWFVGVLILLNLGASVAYLLEADWRRGVFWAAAAVLNAVVTF